ncbi:hypothetical protein ACP4OV_009035 [Aristida adscensionis]
MDRKLKQNTHVTYRQSSKSAQNASSRVVLLSSLLIIAFPPSSSYIVATEPLFTKTLDVISCSADGYRTLIDGQRSKLGDPRHFSHNRPVLPPVEAPGTPRPVFHVELTTPVGGN